MDEVEKAKSPTTGQKVVVTTEKNEAKGGGRGEVDLGVSIDLGV